MTFKTNIQLKEKLTVLIFLKGEQLRSSLLATLLFVILLSPIIGGRFLPRRPWIAKSEDAQDSYKMV